MSYLNFELQGSSGSGITKIWQVQDQDGGPLAVISWYAPWRKYTVQRTNPFSVFDATCLREIADFCENQTKAHKAK